MQFLNWSGLRMQIAIQETAIWEFLASLLWPNCKLNRDFCLNAIRISPHEGKEKSYLSSFPLSCNVAR